MILDPRLHDRVGLRKVLAGVHTENVVGFENGQCHHFAAHREQKRGGVGEVVFALRVAGGQMTKGFPEDGEIKDVTARIDLTDGPFLGVPITLFDDL